MASGTIPAPSMNVVSDTTVSDVSAETATLKNLTSFQLTKGKWLVNVVATFGSNSNGYRQLGVSTSSTVIWAGRTFGNQLDGASSGDTKIFLTIFMTPSSTSTYYINARQNSGSTLTISGIGYQAVRLSD